MTKKKQLFKLLRMLLAGVLAACLVVVAALYLISGGFMKQTYLEPWSKSYAANKADPRVHLAASGLLAASGHNMQPWKIKLDDSDPMVFYLYADSTRMTKEVDPDARQMMISQGTFLEYVAVAGEKNGWKVDITLFPNGEYDEANLAASMDAKPVAKVLLSKADAPKDAATNNALYDAIFLPDTNRSAYEPATLTPVQADTLASLPCPGGVSIKLYQAEQDIKQIGDYAMQSAAIEAGVGRVMDEAGAVFRANEYQKNQYRYGYSVEGQGTSGFMKHVLQGLVTLFPSMNRSSAATKTFISSTQTSVDSTPAYAMIVTVGNSRTQQVESGMLYSRLVLSGHTLGLAMQPLSQVLEEYPEMQALYTAFKQQYAPGGGTVQLLFRVGTPTKPTPLTMRRDVQSLLWGNT